MGRDFPPVQTGLGAHPAYFTTGIGSFPVVKYGWGMLLTTHPLLVPQSWNSRAIPLPTLWATTGPVTGSLYFPSIFKIMFIYSIKHNLFLKILKCSKIYQENQLVLITLLEQVSWIFMVRHHSCMFQILVVWRENSA